MIKELSKLALLHFEILTYRKGEFPRVPRKKFQEYKSVVEGREVTCKLADQGVLLLRGKLRLRQVTRLSDNGHQTPILTSRRDLSAGEVAFRMFERWRQESFFKYLREEYALDALVDYEVVPDNPAREVPNPQRAAIDGSLKEVREELSKLQLKYGVEALENPEWLRPSMRGFKIAQRPLRQSMSAVTKRISSLQSKRSKMPQRVPVENTRREEFVKLAPEKNHLTNLLKMVAYQAESDLFRLVTPH